MAREDSPNPDESAEVPARQKAEGSEIFRDREDPDRTATPGVALSRPLPSLFDDGEEPPAVASEGREDAGDAATVPIAQTDATTGPPPIFRAPSSRSSTAGGTPSTASPAADVGAAAAPAGSPDDTGPAPGGGGTTAPVAASGAAAGATASVAAGAPASSAASTAPDSAEVGVDADSAPPTDALAWVDATTVATPIVSEAMPMSPLVPAGGADLLPAPAPRRGWIWPVAALGVLALGYVVGCAVWPLVNVEPRVSELAVETPAAAQFPLDWPADGGAAIGAADGPGILASNEEVIPMASVTKTITSLMIIERTGLAPGDDGPSYGFTLADSEQYWYYRSVLDESALDVPVDGSLTLHEMLEGVMLGSANNYVDRLVLELWDSREAFVADAAAWLEDNGLSGITMVDPSGIGPGNAATARSLIALAQRAEENPVLSEIMAERAVELPGHGEVTNSNPLIDDAGVVGVKTGSLWSTGVEYWNLLTAKNVQIGDTTVQLYAAVLGQPDADGREEVSRRLLEGAEEGLQPVAAVSADTAVAHISTEWGASSEVVVAQDAMIIPWEGAAADASAPSYDIEVGALADDEVGSLVVTSSFDETTVPLTLTDDVAAPSLWWRLTHPLDLIGLR